MKKNGVRRIDLENKKIILNSTICAGLRNGKAVAEARYQTLLNLYPDFTFEFTRHQNSRNKKSSITYDKMAEIFTKADKACLMDEINNMRFARVIDKSKNRLVPRFAPAEVRQRFYAICEQHDIAQPAVGAEDISPQNDNTDIDSAA